MKKILSYSFLLMVISSTSAVANSVQHDGNNRKTLSCSEFNTSLEQCEEKAKSLCSNNYKLISHNKEDYHDAGDGFYVPTVHHLTVECKE